MTHADPFFAQVRAEKSSFYKGFANFFRTGTASYIY